MTEISTKEKDSLTDNSIDKAFKLFIENIDILSIILKGLIEDFNNIDLETVKTLIPKNKDGDKALIRNTEIVSTHGNTIILDSLFDIPLSNTESVQIVVNIEGQGRPNVGYDLNSRALYYASRLISEQKLSNDGGRYDSLKKVYSIWLIMKPNKFDANSIDKYTIKGNRQQYDGFSVMEKEIEGIDLVT